MSSTESLESWKGVSPLKREVPSLSHNSFSCHCNLSLLSIGTWCFVGWWFWCLASAHVHSTNSTAEIQNWDTQRVATNQKHVTYVYILEREREREKEIQHNVYIRVYRYVSKANNTFWVSFHSKLRSLSEKNHRIGAEELKFLADMLQERRKEVDILRENARLGVSNGEIVLGLWLLIKKKKLTPDAQYMVYLSTFGWFLWYM